MSAEFRFVLSLGLRRRGLALTLVKVPLLLTSVTRGAMIFFEMLS